MGRMTEEELAQIVIQELKDWQWDIYQEVECYGRVADIVAVKGRVQWVIEVKTSFGMKVMEQALRWKWICNYVSIAVPKVKNEFGKFLCRQNGIGIMTRFTESGRPWSHGQMNEILKPSLHRKPGGIELKEIQKNFCNAGSSKGGHWTPFKQTCMNLIEIVQRNEGMEFSQLIKDLDHHYSSYGSARSCLLGFIGTVIPELRTEIVGGKLCVFTVK